MKNDPYKIVANIYDHLMKTISYYEWSHYITDLQDYYATEAKSFLEIAAGSGRLAFYLSKQFQNLILLDISKSMLDFVDKNLKRVCANMTAIPFKNKFDFIYSTFDSINYLLTENEVQKYFNEIAEILSNNGAFTFDAGLENNSVKNVKHLNRKGKFNNIFYVQKSFYDYESKIHINKFKVMLENGEIFEEVHSQKIYDFELYFELAENAGLHVVDCFDAFTFEDATRDSERIQFIMKKRNYA